MYINKIDRDHMHMKKRTEITCMLKQKREITCMSKQKAAETTCTGINKSDIDHLYV